MKIFLTNIHIVRNDLIWGQLHMDQQKDKGHFPSCADL